MRYEGMVYRPPSEAQSLIIQATIGCPHNRCTFCSLYKNTKFRIRPVEEIKEDLRMARDYYGEYIESVFFADGNTIIMKTEQLLDIFEYTRSLFPYLERITVYGSSRFVNKKSLEDLKRLRAAGLKRIHTGMESGDDIILERIKKGTNSQEIISAGLKLKEAGISVSEYYLVGIGGKERSREHALNSALTLSAFSPDFIRLRTYVPMPNTPLYDDYQNGVFALLSPHEALREVRLLIENLNCDNSQLLSDHINNYWNVYGILPQDKDKMLAEIDRALAIDESRFRRPEQGRL
ncbi:radical SAM protein [Syntrophomonas wolfei]|uniref:Oxygen-independent coproporphyrinogen III oxidase, putative n=1 Tax=Syntrophomonas wolfei subsp. wolfei (strain DSM 2245B / Goettingen) TaxID=335541 RepID=Q0AZS4_SYNWW|nr:radical SAM protein [Syntrophomonas wolfei]ABI67780.1 oxygen-independent coproporphyrinogen III oxidase, putative [Syntrophomonas wolfei subsp. wolfei str. Goettingen G311]